MEIEYAKQFGTETKETGSLLVLADHQLDHFAVISTIYRHNDMTHPQPLCRTFPKDRYDAVAIMTDGATSFQRTIVEPTSKRLEKVPVCEVLAEVLNFKNYSGFFVQRRCKAALKKFADENTLNMDDFSIGVVCDVS